MKKFLLLMSAMVLAANVAVNAQSVLSDDVAYKIK